jgi:hypothetical protein
VLGLQQVELVMLRLQHASLNMENRGFEAHHLRVFHSHLSIHAAATRMPASPPAVAAATRTGTSSRPFHHRQPAVRDHGPATSWGDELIVADCDLGMCERGRRTIFNFAAHRRVEAMG